ncbi:dihydrofolate reductase family protein [Sphingomonas sp.]|jgi:dihydrofolate reductase|uniref:dihydrofolate reductase family protein n=1 Tax=Sphingomonas sp. TaxID=28214 RepID=UPI00260EF578|nr:dihydrofolate reductase family protein [Sphingomonas sp.]MDF2494003.1 dihydrofolate reductase [Sphingomonas sp.]
MRKITGGLFMSIDGVIQAPGGPDEDPSGGFAHGGWMAGYDDDATSDFIGEHIMGAEYDLLLGRRTYDIFADYWPRHVGNPVGERFGRITKYVVTSNPETLGWQGSQALVGDPAAAVARLCEEDGPDLLIQGSGQLYPALLGAGLIDRLFLTIVPIILGKGRRALTGGSPAGLRLVDHRVSGTGVIMAVYERDGAVRTGDFTRPDGE